jgi:hypothetical protein
MRTFLRVALSFLAGLIVTYVAVVAGALWYMDANRVFDREGAMSMAIMFAIGPLGGLIGGIICAIAVPIWLQRRDLRRGTINTTPRPPQPQPQAQRVGLAIVLAGIPAYLLAWGALRLYTGTSFESYWAALAVSYTPIIVAIAAAALAAFVVGRNAAPPA